MKINITLTVEVDVDAWKLTYGPQGPVRADVVAYVLNHVQGSAAADEGAITNVAVKA